MLINFIVILLVLFIGLIYRFGVSGEMDSPSNRKQYVKVICFILILQSGLRNIAVGNDTYGYSLSYQEVKEMSWSEVFNSFYEYISSGIGKDPGYEVFQKVAQIFFPQYQLFLFLVAIIFFSAFGSFLYKNTQKLSHLMFAFVLYSVLYYSFFSITGIRQTLVTAATFWGIEMIKKKRLFAFLSLILIAATIHKSCLVFLPFYFIAHYNRPKHLYIIALTSFPILMAFRGVISLFSALLTGYDQYSDYDGNAGAFTFTLMLILVGLGSFILSKKIMSLNSSAKIYLNAYAIAMMLTPLAWVNPSSMRIVQYFSIFMLVLIPLILQTFQSFSKEVGRLVYVLALFVVIVLFFKTNGSFEYKFFWQKMELPEGY